MPPPSSATSTRSRPSSNADLQNETQTRKEITMAKSDRDQRIDYIEFSVGDIARSRDFYGKAFGWSFKDYGPSYCEFGDGRLTGGFALGGAGTPGGRIRPGCPLVI